MASAGADTSSISTFKTNTLHEYVSYWALLDTHIYPKNQHISSQEC